MSKTSKTTSNDRSKSNFSVKINLKKNSLIADIIEFIIVFLLVFIFYKGLGYALHTPDPVLSVVSCSMLPTLQRGDLIVVKGIKWQDIKATGKWADPNSTIVVYYLPSQRKLIVHRAYLKFNNNHTLITWGDNNPIHDPWVVKADEIKGTPILRIPYLGYLRIWLGDLLGQDTGGCDDYRFYRLPD